MVVARRIIALSVASDQRQTMVEISRSRTEPANRVERSRIILAYLDEPSAYGVAQRMGLTRQTVKRCLERAAELGVVAARRPCAQRPRPGDHRGSPGLACRTRLCQADAVPLPA
jgi:hypothetical protein